MICWTKFRKGHRQASLRARHRAAASIGGRYLGWLARPDRWMMALRRRQRRLRSSGNTRQVLCQRTRSTAHVIGHARWRRTRLPWIADFRDPMAQDGYPADPATWRSFRQIETYAVADARYSTFDAGCGTRIPPVSCRRGPHPGARKRLRRRKFHRTFPPGGARAARAQRRDAAPCGIVYPSERDPTFFMAIAHGRGGHVQAGG